MSRLQTIADYMKRGTVTIQEQGFAWQLNDEDKADVIGALEKRMPKKCRNIGFELQCADCGAVLPDLEAYDYCPWCGQAIDWEVE